MLLGESHRNDIGGQPLHLVLICLASDTSRKARSGPESRYLAHKRFAAVRNTVGFGV